MPTFSAINLEPEEALDEEVDNTRDIQVDDALKLFQAALKLHAQGPKSYTEAEAAYDTLFESEIFKYPDSTTEYERAERQRDSTLAVEPSSFASSLEAAVTDADGSGSSLPQALYLSFKNHGQFLLDKIRHKARVAGKDNHVVFEEPSVLEDAHKALDDFCVAFDRDPSDAELWRRAARVAAFLRSARIGRYCLEAAVELDDDPAVVEVEPPSLAEGFAGEQLKNQLQVLSDDMALSHPIMTPFIKKELAPVLKRYLEPFPFLPNPTETVALPHGSANRVPERFVIDVSIVSWAELGMGLVRFVAEHGLPGQAVLINMPDAADDPDLMQMEIDNQLQGHHSLAKESTKKEEDTSLGNTSAEGPSETQPEVSRGTSGSKEPPTQPETRKERSFSLPSRKRSQSVAGLPEPPDEENGDTKRSKRIRRRDTAAAEEVMDITTLYATQLQPYQAADQNLFQLTKNTLENLGVTDRAPLDRITEMLDLCASEDRMAKISRLAAADLRDCLVSFDEETARVLLEKTDTPALGLNAFLEHTKSGSQCAAEIADFDEGREVSTFVKRMNSAWSTVQDVAFEWILFMSKSYSNAKWSDNMKTAVVQLVCRLDPVLYERVVYELEQCAQSHGGRPRTLLAIDNLVEMLFELYLDIYERITNPNSVVEYAVRVETKGRLGRWLDLASGLSRSRSESADGKLSLRFLWSAVFSSTLAEGVSRDHVLQCWAGLRDFLATREDDQVYLPNNAVIQEISSTAADKEISKLTTMDFFLGLFQEDLGDPVSVIDTLEPVLNPNSVFVADNEIQEGADRTDGNGELAGKLQASRVPITERANQGLRDLWKFLLGSSTDLRLFLWTRLGDAYQAIDYPTKQFSCYLRSIEMVVADLDKDASNNTPPEARRLRLMKLLQLADELLIRALSMALNDNSSFDIVDDEHLRSTSAALAKLNCLLHVSAMYEDEIRIGMTQAASNSATFQSLLHRLREMQVRTWSLQYTILKVGISQNAAVFPTQENDLAEYLAAVHQVLGLRKFCKSSNKIFLKMMRVELLKQSNIENWEDHLGQVLYDLHGLKLGVGMWEVQDHGCPTEKLEKRSAMGLVEKIMTLANRMPMKDLLKSDLKATIEAMQQAIGQTKSTPQMIHNLRNFTEYLKRPIHPLRLYQALTGNVCLDAVTVHTPESALAKHGWFFLLGMIALTKFKGVDLNRRQTPGATDDLRIGATFLRLQLQFTPDRWDAWFRLAECFDYELDEAVLWTADKMNKDRVELVKFQRNSIHCYTLALSSSQASSAEMTDEESDALYELYHKFGMRLYASSREPFAMEPFHHADQKRFFIESMGAGTFKKILHGEMSDYKVWKYAAGLFRQAMAGRPKDWKNYYMYAKCIWKMYEKPIDDLGEKDKLSRPAVQTVISSLEQSVKAVSLLPKPRHGQTPILEPHYKIVSIVHKLVVRGDLSAQDGADILQHQPYAVNRGDQIIISDSEDWETFVIKRLRQLRDKDKHNWQHRIVVRHARILFDGDGEGPGDYLQAKAAFSVLKESMFTRTMVLNVWKCDAERPGRHHVYTEQYVRLMTKLLTVLNDRENMEALLRRIRKKGADFYHFPDLWQSCVMAYVRLIRKSYEIPALAEEPFKAMTSEEFEIVGERIMAWSNGNPGLDHHALNALKEAIELKKLNASLTKAAPIDDLISDCYCLIHTEISPDLPGPEPAQVIEERNKDREQERIQLQHDLERIQLDSAHDKDMGDAAATTVGVSKDVNGSLAPTGTSTRGGSEMPEAQKMEKSASNTGEPTARRRFAGVRRPDILRKAEQLALRALEQGPKSAGATGSGRRGRMGSMSSVKLGAGTGAESENDEGNGQDGDMDMKNDEDGVDGDSEGEGRVGGAGPGGGLDGSDASSPPGSVHDSADDESDLSDVPADYEDNAPPMLLFPNLRKSVDAGVGGDSEGDGSDAGSTGGGEEGSSPAANGGHAENEGDESGDEVDHEMELVQAETEGEEDDSEEGETELVEEEEERGEDETDPEMAARVVNDAGDYELDATEEDEEAEEATGILDEAEEESVDEDGGDDAQR